MGKHKKQEKRPKSDSESESESDSGPEDRNEPAPKKSKGEGSASKRFKTDNGETYFELERNRRVTVREFKSKLFVDVREFYEKDGELKPGKKGISLSAVQWNKLKSMIPDIDEVVQEMS
ncbi:Activated RNA polymerase II transcriptional coactivator p15 [Chionoecetes opilio]|uniref:Activated RNA polymerase II transcriptional coactivator p15 n=1 Tax=Chionoecetes opilio TaxID=41210 RepID=A0A8J4YJ76_CHIOP|nr:Activated RNA polymerase II transcriptional coactivator p15 [Chionoecetes opilio]